LRTWEKNLNVFLARVFMPTPLEFPILQLLDQEKYEANEKSTQFAMQESNSVACVDRDLD
jgi:hypothetical protein